MTLVKLYEGHYFVKIKLCVKIVIQCGSKVVNRVVTEINSIAFAVINKMGDTIDIVSFKTLGEKFVKIAWVNR